MDEIDREIIRCLRSNARSNASSIGKKVGLSISAVSARINKLESMGIIKKYTAILDRQKIGEDVTAFISVAMEHPKYNKRFIDTVSAYEYVLQMHYITGDFDFIIKISVSSTKALEHALSDIKSVQGVSSTRTLIVLSTHKDEN